MVFLWSLDAYPLEISNALAASVKVLRCTIIITISPERKPSSLPGIVNLDIGNNFNTLFILPPLPFATNQLMTLTVPTKGFKGASAYIQAVYITDNPKIVQPVTDVWETKIQ